jgi:hypothetical protein
MNTSVSVLLLGQVGAGQGEVKADGCGVEAAWPLPPAAMARRACSVSPLRAICFEGPHEQLIELEIMAGGVDFE